MLTEKEKQELQEELQRIQILYNVALDMKICKLFLEELKEEIK